MPQRKPIRIGTRGSRLALTQAGIVRDLLAGQGHDSEIVVIKTSGDRIQDRPLADAGGKGLFTKELEEALFAGDADVAVHSMKDVPTHLPDGLILGAFLPREDPRDVLVSNKPQTLTSLPSGAIIGTSSVRRRAQLLRARNDVEAVTLRGNVDTRLSKVESGSFEAAILALAGLKRLGLQDRATTILDSEKWLPSPAQGAIGIELRADDVSVREAIAKLNHEPTAIALSCERAFLAALDGSCRTPIAALATIEDGMLKFRGEVLSPDGRDWVENSFEQKLDSHNDAERWGKRGRFGASSTCCEMARYLMRVLVTRPLEDATSTASRLRQMGHAPLISPMLEIHFRDVPEPSLAGVQALVATSTNGIRAFIRHTNNRNLPVFAVGARTAATAHQAGFANVKHSDGDSVALAKAIAGWAKPEAGILFHAAGNETAGKLAEQLREYGFKFRRDVLYDVVSVEALPQEAIAALRACELDAVLLYSPRSAETFSRFVQKADLVTHCHDLIAVCISEAAAEKSRDLPLREIRVARRPAEDAMFEALQR